MGICLHLNGVSFHVFVVVMLFSMSTWVDVVGIWVEVPLLVNTLPEGWGLPAILTILIQCANIGPATYALICKFKAQSSVTTSFLKIRNLYLSVDVIVAFVIIVISTLSIFFMCFFWKYTVVVAGNPRSIPLFILVSTTALVSCMSSVVFLPYMARFSAVYITAYYIGQGLSGLLPGFVGLIQGTGQEPVCINTTVNVFNETTNSSVTRTSLEPYYKPPLFSVDCFLGFIVCLLIVSLVAFYLLNFAEFCKKEMVVDIVASVKNDKNEDFDESELPFTLNASEEMPQTSLESDKTVAESDLATPDSQDVALKQEMSEDTKASQPSSSLGFHSFVLLLTMVGVVNAMTNGIIPATQSYTCLPYGSLVYTLSVRLSSVASPLASLSSMFLPKPSVRILFFLTSIGVLISVFHVTLAAQSPTPIMKGQRIGDSVVIISSVIMAASYSFVRVSVASILRQSGGRRELLWCGGITQVGSFFGAFLTFLLVQVFHVFNGVKPCLS